MSQHRDSDEDFINVCQLLANIYANQDCDSSYYYMEAAERVARQGGKIENMVKVYRVRGSMAKHCGHFEFGLEQYQKAWMLIKSQHLEKDNLGILSEIASSYYDAGFTEAALKYQLDQLTLTKKYINEQNQVNLHGIYGNLGFTWMTLAVQDSAAYDSAYFYMNAALQESKKFGSSWMEAVSQDYLGLLELEQKHYDRAAPHFRAALALILKIDPILSKEYYVFKGRASYGLARVFKGNNQADSVIKYTDLAEKAWNSNLETQFRIRDKFPMLTLLRVYAFEEMGDLDKAEQLLNTTLIQVDTMSGRSKSESKIYLQAAKFYARRGMFEKGFHAQLKHQQLEQESRENANKFFFFSNHSFLTSAGLQLELESKERENVAAIRIKNLSIGITVLALLLLVLGMLLLRYFIKSNRAIKAYSQELVSLNQTKDVLMSVIGHDLRSPFGALMGISEQMEQHVEDKNWDSLEVSARIINGSAKEAFYLFEDLLGWAKAQSGQLPFRPEEVSPASLYSEALLVLTGMAEAKNVQIRFEGKDLMAIGDVFMLRTLLRNLISNAIKFSPEGAVVLVSAAPIGKSIEISIRDEGIGMSPQEIENIQKGEVTHKGNSGLGLVLCQKFALAHDTQLQIESNPKRGSRFSFLLPQSDREVNSDLAFSASSLAEQRLSQELIAGLSPHADSLAPFRDLEIYHISHLKKLLDDLQVNDSQHLAEWKQRLNRAIVEFNEAAFRELIACIPPGHETPEPSDGI